MRLFSRFSRLYCTRPNRPLATYKNIRARVYISPQFYPSSHKRTICIAEGTARFAEGDLTYIKGSPSAWQKVSLYATNRNLSQVHLQHIVQQDITLSTINHATCRGYPLTLQKHTICLQTMSIVMYLPTSFLTLWGELAVPAIAYILFIYTL